jgi:hypothetical protein
VKEERDAKVEVGFDLKERIVDLAREHDDGSAIAQRAVQVTRRAMALAEVDADASLAAGIIERDDGQLGGHEVLI